MKIPFGRLGFEVSRICLGTGSSGNGGDSMQAQQLPRQYLKTLQRAFDLGITFWDTALVYGSHAHVRLGLKTVGRENVVLSTKIKNRNPAETRSQIERCQRELETDVLDVVLMHEVDRPEDLECGVLEEMHLAEGVRAVGISTHSIEVLEQAVIHPLVKCVFTNYNVANEHMDASMEDYEAALKEAHRLGKGVYVHKTLNEGKLAHRYEEAVGFNLSREFIHSVCLGMIRPEHAERAVAQIPVSQDARAC